MALKIVNLINLVDNLPLVRLDSLPFEMGGVCGREFRVVDVVREKTRADGNTNHPKGGLGAAVWSAILTRIIDKGKARWTRSALNDLTSQWRDLLDSAKEFVEIRQFHVDSFVLRRNGALESGLKEGATKGVDDRYGPEESDY
jgi:hypothetical protein